MQHNTKCMHTPQPHVAFCSTCQPCMHACSLKHPTIAKERAANQPASPQAARASRPGRMRQLQLLMLQPPTACAALREEGLMQQRDHNQQQQRGRRVHNKTSLRCLQTGASSSKPGFMCVCDCAPAVCALCMIHSTSMTCTRGLHAALDHKHTYVHAC